MRKMTLYPTDYPLRKDTAFIVSLMGTSVPALTILSHLHFREGQYFIVWDSKNC